MLHLLEVRLRHDAADGVRAAGDGEDVVHAAVGSLGDGAAGAEGEGKARFANGAVGRDEERNLIGGAGIEADGHLRILTDEGINCGAGAGAADGRLGVTTGATGGIETGAETFSRLAGNVAADGINLQETRETVLEELELRRGQSSERLAGA